ncbi:leucine-rich repeat protein, partial [Treponema sp. R8-4-B8]
LTNITLSHSITSINPGTFRNNLLTSVTIPNNITFIGDNAFYSNPITSVTIGANVEINNAIPGNFANSYQNNGKTAGIYTRPDTLSEIWTKQ